LHTLHSQIMHLHMDIPLSNGAQLSMLWCKRSLATQKSTASVSSIYMKPTISWSLA
jgi:hypothetical protein